MIPASVASGVIAGICLPLICFCAKYFFSHVNQRNVAARGGKTWQTFTPPKIIRDEHGNLVWIQGEQVDFDPRHGHYLKCAEVLITLSSASLIFIPGLHLTGIHPWFAFPLVLLGFTVVYALLFMGVLTQSYEQFLFNPLSYGIGRTAINYALGFGALSCFALAYFTIAIQLGLAYANGSIVAK